MSVHMCCQDTAQICVHTAAIRPKPRSLRLQAKPAALCLAVHLLPGFTVAPEPESIHWPCIAALCSALGPLALRLGYIVIIGDSLAEVFGDLLCGDSLFGHCS